MARLGKTVISLAMIGIAYWYWTGPYQHSAKMSPGDDPKQNAEVMKLCVEREDYEDELSGDVGSAGKDPVEACANKIGLYKMYGKWHRQ